MRWQTDFIAALKLNNVFSSEQILAFWELLQERIMIPSTAVLCRMSLKLQPTEF